MLRIIRSLCTLKNIKNSVVMQFMFVDCIILLTQGGEDHFQEASKTWLLPDHYIPRFELFSYGLPLVLPDVPIFRSPRPVPRNHYAGRQKSQFFVMHNFFLISFSTTLLDRLNRVEINAIKRVKTELLHNAKFFTIPPKGMLYISTC